MKNIFTTILAAGLLWTSQAMAQDVKPSLDAAPAPAVSAEPALTEAAIAPVATATADEKPAWTGPKLSYSLSTGASFSNGFGNAQFMTPSVRYHLNNRFRVNASMTYMNVSSYNTPAFIPEGTTVMYRNSGGSHYIASVGVDYLASDRLILSGNIWKDFSNLPAQNMNYGLYSPGRLGADLQATYKITENFSVSGGIRYREGGSPFASPFYNPGFGTYNRNGFGY
ncbi:hypothetical protein ACFS7Z_19165 [Pontibacter toksunensis]|uniref:Uncharacterized protein n=1 Tax=Pontibacter toksunensis TaxID=1332631 RepID=A0ABW6BYN7_9BACT